MLFELIHFVYVLQDCRRKEKSPADDLSPRSPPLESEVNPLQELTHVCYKLFNNHLQILWDASVFGVDGVPLYISMQDILELIKGNQMLNITIIQLWMM